MIFEEDESATRLTIPWLKYSTKRIATQEWNSDDLGLRSPVLQKTF